MLFSVTLLSNKGGLGKVWLAGHKWDKSVSKRDIENTDLSGAINDIVEPRERDDSEVTLRISAQLLLGIVRIYSRKLKYLQDDALDALSRMKISFRAISLPQNRVQSTHLAKERNITIQDSRGDIDLEFEINDVPLEELLGLSGDRFESESSFLEIPLSSLQTIEEREVIEPSKGINHEREFHVEDMDIMALEPSQDLDLEYPRRYEGEEDQYQMQEFTPLDDFNLDNGDLLSLANGKDDVSAFDKASLLSFNLSLDSTFPEAGAKIEIRPIKRRKVQKEDKNTQLSEAKFKKQKNSLEIRSPDFTILRKDPIDLLAKLREPMQMNDDIQKLFKQSLSKKSVIPYMTDNAGLDDIGIDDIPVEGIPFELQDMDFVDVPVLENNDYDYPPSNDQFDYNEEDYQKQNPNGMEIENEQEIEEGSSDRSIKALALIKKAIESSKVENTTTLSSIIDGKSKRAAAVMFHEVLLLKTNNHIQVNQTSPFEDIQISITEDHS